MKTLQLKKLKIGALFLVLIAFAITSISCEKPPLQDENRITQEDIQTMKDAHLITLDKAVKGYKKYGKDRVKILKDTLKEKYKDKDFNDTRNVWVDIKTLKAYIQYIEDNASDSEGFEFYFSVNSDKTSGKKKNHQTFFIAPTVQNIMDGDTIQSGFTVKNGKRVFLYEEFKKYLEEGKPNVQKASFLNLVQDGDGYLFNEIIPNPPGNNN